MTPSERAARNEQVKLTATTINTVGLAFLVTGVVVPLISLLYGADAIKSPRALAIGVWWAVQFILLHLTARRVLRGVQA